METPVNFDSMTLSDSDHMTTRTGAVGPDTTLRKKEIVLNEGNIFLEEIWKRSLGQSKLQDFHSDRLTFRRQASRHAVPKSPDRENHNMGFLDSFLMKISCALNSQTVMIHVKHIIHAVFFN